ncbi:MAG TPA: arginine--tRNA ligase [Planctomycetota bacterium]|nr:arginine--tRNA ligase [Planctomycetota bacterium]
MQRFVDQILEALARRTGLARGELRLEHPRDPKLGDLAFPCFALAKAQRRAPAEIAADLARALDGELDDVAALATGPYVNFRIDRGLLAAALFASIEGQGERYGGSDEGRGRTIVIDLSSPNIAKPMHVGHLRSTILGAAIQRLHDALGYRTVGINHIGDWGAQFGKLVAAIQRWGDTVDLEGAPIRSLLALYVRYHEEEDRDPSLAEAARAAFRELESGEEGEVRRIWRHLTELSLREFDKVYRRLGVRFDLVRGEAFYEPHLEPTVERVRAAGILQESQGALVVDLEPIEKGMPPCLLRKSDGTTLYATRDLAALFHRWEEFAFERCLYVVGSDQKLHFRQLKGVLKRMGIPWEERVEHVDFGMLRLPEGKMSTRKGQVVFLDEVLDAVVAEAQRIVAEKNPDLAGREEVAEEVGIGAVIFNDLKRERIRDVVFDIGEVLSFEGETGPYVQYTHARLASILRKAATDRALASGAIPDLSQLEEAGPILVRLGRFPDVVRSAARDAEPSQVSVYLLGLCRDLNSWYAENRVLGVDPALSAARLGLIRASKQVLASGLRLLGLAAPEEM